MPYTSPAGDVRILKVTRRGDILSVVNGKTTDAMTFLEKQFGRNITTRNWNTIVKIAKELAAR